MSIMLSFGATAANGAWDDRELVSAYDTAMAEFHVSGAPQSCCSRVLKLIPQAHHPGPGSWLDKVTAQKQLEEQAGSSSQTNPVSVALHHYCVHTADNSDGILLPKSYMTSKKKKKNPSILPRGQRNDLRIETIIRPCLTTVRLIPTSATQLLVNKQWRLPLRPSIHRHRLNLQTLRTQP